MRVVEGFCRDTRCITTEVTRKHANGTAGQLVVRQNAVRVREAQTDLFSGDLEKVTTACRLDRRGVGGRQPHQMERELDLPLGLYGLIKYPRKHGTLLTRVVKALVEHGHGSRRGGRANGDNPTAFVLSLISEVREASRNDAKGEA